MNNFSTLLFINLQEEITEYQTYWTHTGSSNAVSYNIHIIFHVGGKPMEFKVSWEKRIVQPGDYKFTLLSG